ncbi:glycine-rich domain-containing protein [Loktanella agnita]|uniref:glycine-rich domain-containing protein n=1 Tax=Loktanella agnita TaxID=287097 RepID=UPI003986D426
MKRTKTDRKLWHRLEGYSFHERPLTRSLVDRLEDETGHSTDVCYTLVEEYRRFMYLMGSTGETLSPSPIVDLVWRLHIQDQRAYFEDFCPRIIGRTIHHPEDFPPLQHDPGYERTLEYYAQEFGRPLVQYWPDPDVSSVRFSTGLMWIIGVAAFALSVIFGSYVFAFFGAFVITASAFLQWKFSSLPLQNLTPEGDHERSV